MQPPAGAGNVVTVFVPGLAPKFAPDGALTITIPEPPFPPVDAGLAKNKVISYIRDAGKEYWKEPIFTEIKNCELNTFIKKTILFIKWNKNFDKNKNYIKKFNFF